MAADRSLLTALAALQRALHESGAPSMIIGGIAVIGRGGAGDMSDIDAAVWGSAIEPEALLAVLARYAIKLREDDPVGFARQSHMLLMKHVPTGVTLDIAFSFLPFEREAMARASVVEFGGVPIRAATAEDLIVYKATAWRNRDRADIERLLTREDDRRRAITEPLTPASRTLSPLRGARGHAACAPSPRVSGEKVAEGRMRGRAS